MALNISIPKSDLAKGIPISNGWHEFEIDKPFVRPTKDGQSVNYIIPLKLIGDPNERVIEHLFSAKALGMMAPFVAALVGKTVQEVLNSITSGVLNFDLENQVGRKVMAKVEQKEYEGRIQSKIVDWAAQGKVPF